ncbi:FecR family protein [Pedobacter sp. AW1-32]|uniref:FecR family protein n=1 Tax=Pedobacter sp. AW1-32 TaxID=3383026 RepID=UPI003FEE4C45
MKKRQAKELIRKYRKEKTTDLENLAIEHWLELELDNDLWSKTEEERANFKYELKQKIDKIIDRKNTAWPGFTTKTWLKSVAVFFLIVAPAMYIWKIQSLHVLDEANDIKPGGYKATLTLSNGRKIDLSQNKIGELTEIGGIKVLKTADGKVKYIVDRDSAAQSLSNNAFNTLETPKGGEFQIELPDGTVIWLNAESSIRYRANFYLKKERQVDLSGEAYFEVAKDKNRPFLVNCENYQVKVLGTHFNVNGYASSGAVKTTLLEGAVDMAPTDGSAERVQIKPGQSAVFSDSGVTLGTADVELDLAWKNQEFIFRDETLAVIMEQLARWYDVDVIFEGNTASKRFNGAVSRFKHISEILKKFELTKDVQFKIEGRRLTVMP